MRTAIVIAVALVLGGAPRVQKKTTVNSPVIKAFTSSSYKIDHCPFRLSLCTNTDRRIKLNTDVEDKGTLTYTYAVSAGRIEGSGATVIWNLDDVPVGEHTATVSVKKTKGGLATATLTINIAECGTCHPPPPRCPEITVSCPGEIEKGKPIIFTANVKDDPLSGDVSYEWWASSGKIVKGQFEKIMTLEPAGFRFETTTVTVSVGGFDPSCATQASCTISIKR